MRGFFVGGICERGLSRPDASLHRMTVQRCAVSARYAETTCPAGASLLACNPLKYMQGSADMMQYRGCRAFIGLRKVFTK